MVYQVAGISKIFAANVASVRFLSRMSEHVFLMDNEYKIRFLTGAPTSRGKLILFYLEAAFLGHSFATNTANKWLQMDQKCMHPIKVLYSRMNAAINSNYLHARMHKHMVA